MKRELIFYENHFIEFYQVLDEKVKEKIQYVFELIKQVEKFQRNSSNIYLEQMVYMKLE
jgi:hypothetical protein